MAIDNTQLMALVNDLEAKESSLADASTANDQAQASAQAAVAAAAATLSGKNAAHDELSTSVKALVDYVNGLVA